jgi:hypothetical protein
VLNYTFGESILTYAMSLKNIYDHLTTIRSTKISHMSKEDKGILAQLATELDAGTASQLILRTAPNSGHSFKTFETARLWLQHLESRGQTPKLLLLAVREIAKIYEINLVYQPVQHIYQETPRQATSYNGSGQELAAEPPRRISLCCDTLIGKSSTDTLTDKTLSPLPAYEHQKEPIQKLQEDSDEDKCVICLDNKANHVIIECGHVALCGDCTKGLKNCPICRNIITRTIKIYTC